MCYILLLSCTVMLVICADQTAAFTKSYSVGIRMRRNERLCLGLKVSHNGEGVEEFGGNQRDPMWHQRSTKWVLLVDDEEAIRRAVGQLLFEKGYQVTACADGSTALRLAHRMEEGGKMSIPDAIVSDIRMPGMDGIDLLLAIRADKDLVQVPVVLLTAKGLTQDRIAGYDAGADAYIPKPFDPEELVSILDNLIERRETLDPGNIDINALKRDLGEIRKLLLQKGGGGVGNGFVEATEVFLAPDEKQVLELLCQGLVNKEIGERTFMSTRRVEQLLTSMYRKTNVKNRTELVRWAVSTGNVQLP